MPDRISRPTSDHDRAALKAAVARAVRRAGGPTALATQTRGTIATISRHAAAHDDDHYMPVDVAADADMAAGAPIILTALAAIEGYTLRRADAAVHFCPGMVGALIRETADVSASVLEAMADGVMTPRERSAVMVEIDEALAALFTLRNAISADVPQEAGDA